MKKLLQRVVQDNKNTDSSDIDVTPVVVSINKLKNWGNLKKIEKSFVNKISGKTYKKNVQVKIKEDPKKVKGAHTEEPASPKTGQHPQDITNPQVQKPEQEQPNPSTPKAEKPGKSPSKEKLKPIKKKSAILNFHGDIIKEKISTDKDYAIEQMLLMLEYQTEKETKVKSTIYKNNVGFNKPDAEFFNKFMDRVRDAGGMKHLEQSMGKDEQNQLSSQIQGRMRKYGNQLADIYNDNNQYRNFKTVADMFKEAKQITDAQLNALDPSIWGGPEGSTYEHLDQFKETLKMATPEDLQNIFGNEKKKGPKQKADGLVKRFDNAKTAAEMYYMMKEVGTNPNQNIKNQYQKYYDAKIQDKLAGNDIDALMEKGFGTLNMKQKNMLKEHMKKMAPYIADVLNVYKDMGMPIPVTKKFTGKSLKTIQSETLTKLEEKTTGPEPTQEPTPKEEPKPEPAPKEEPKPEPEPAPKPETTPEPTPKEEPKPESTAIAKNTNADVFDKELDNIPDELNGIPFSSINDVISELGGKDEFFKSIFFMDKNIYEPSNEGVTHAGMVLVEPDGRVWINNSDKGHSFASASKKYGLGFQQTAHKALYEKTGMVGEIVGHLDDIVGNGGITRYYIARRLGGTPKDAPKDMKLMTADDALYYQVGGGAFFKNDRGTAVAKKINDILSDPSHSLTQVLSQKPEKNQIQMYQAKQKIAKGPDPYNFKIDEFDVDWGTQGGSNKGGIATHKESGDKYYVKQSKSPDHAANEVVASKLYREFGLNSPRIDYVDFGNGVTGTATKQVDGLEKFDKNNIDHVKEARKGFLVDSFLANWDVFGLEFDNAHVSSSGDIVRIDPGGSLLYRGMGGEKGKLFGDSVSELDTMQNRGQASEVFGKKSILGEMTDSEILSAFKNFKKVGKDKIQNIVKSAGKFSSSSTMNALSDKLGKRYDDLMNKFDSLVVPKQKAQEAFLGVKKEDAIKHLSTNQKSAIENAGSFGEVSDKFADEMVAKWGQYGYTVDDIYEISNLIFESTDLLINRQMKEHSKSYQDLYDNGKMKNVFELAIENGGIGKGSGASDTPWKGDKRDQVEGVFTDGALHDYDSYKKTSSGDLVPEDVAKERPMYGYVFDHEKGNTAASYGYVSFRVKKDAYQKATICSGDSFGVDQKSYAMKRIGTPQNNAPLVRSTLDVNAYSYSPKELKEKIKNKNFSFGYDFMETHIYGGVSMQKDVDSIVIQDTGYGKDQGHVIEFAKKYDLPYEIRKYGEAHNVVKPLSKDYN